MDLFTPWQLGPLALANRIVMAPLTRCRAGEGLAPTPLNARYYVQRASAGLIVSEATQVSPQGIGYPGTPGMYTAAQVAGWRAVTDAIHAAGGKIFSQLWHVGRSSHTAYQEEGALPVSSSAVAIRGSIPTPQGMQPYPTPRALELDEIPGVIDQYRQAARHALAAGFDGVELHGANGYLPDQFLRDGVNRRTDAYGGPVENRARFHLEATQALIEVWGADRVGARISPSGTFNDMSDSNPCATFGYLAKKLGELGVVYLHVVEATTGDLRHGGENVPASFFRPLFHGALIACGGYTLERAQQALAAGDADAIAFGVLFLANPDLPKRFRRGAELNTPDPSTFYGGGEKGYLDYPTLVG
ncbi:MAG TPA: alkene reductase [Pirellulales bacterium]